MVDEGDSVLVDEARVPLIISGSTDAPVEKYQTAAKCAAVSNVLQNILRLQAQHCPNSRGVRWENVGHKHQRK